jgi:hypothetical protein
MLVSHYFSFLFADFHNRKFNFTASRDLLFVPNASVIQRFLKQDGMYVIWIIIQHTITRPYIPYHQ